MNYSMGLDTYMYNKRKDKDRKRVKVIPICGFWVNKQYCKKKKKKVTAMQLTKSANSESFKHSSRSWL